MKYPELVTKRESYFTHNLNRPAVEAFIKFIEKYQETRGFVIPSNEKELPGLDISQRNNFQKLRHFGLIKAEKGIRGYLPTQKGLQFATGRVPCMDIVATFQNEIVAYDHESWDTHGVKPTSKYIFEYLDIAEYTWKQKEEYQAEKSPQLTLC